MSGTAENGRDAGGTSRAATSTQVGFTAVQLWLGVLVAWIVSSTLVVAGWALYARTSSGPARSGADLVGLTISLVAICATLISAVGCSALGAPLGAILGLALRRVRPLSVHLLLFGLLGALVAALITGLLLCVTWDGFQIPDSLPDWAVQPFIINLVAGAIAAATGRSVAQSALLSERFAGSRP